MRIDWMHKLIIGPADMGETRTPDGDLRNVLYRDKIGLDMSIQKRA